ncbi:MAG TPA: hypothetical protein PKD54_02910 [Pirellulaceae bacterium]|nr:hypothetical protein [Pirellulaceae bacterium]
MNNSIDETTLKEVVGLSEARVREHLDHFLRKLSGNVDERVSQVSAQGRWGLVIGVIGALAAMLAIALIARLPFDAIVGQLSPMNQELQDLNKQLTKLVEVQQTTRLLIERVDEKMSTIANELQQLKELQQAWWEQWKEINERRERENSQEKRGDQFRQDTSRPLTGELLSRDKD